MAEETRQIAFTHKEVAEVLVRHQGLREGIWGLYVEFGLGAANVGPSENLNPVAIVPVLKIGLQRFPEINNLSVDAAQLDSPKAGTATVVRTGRGKKRT